jgi:hypothetical protein
MAILLTGAWGMDLYIELTLQWPKKKRVFEL